MQNNVDGNNIKAGRRRSQIVPTALGRTTTGSHLNIEINLK